MSDAESIRPRVAGWVVIGFALPVVAAAEERGYEDVFTHEAMRVDYHHWGDAGSEGCAVDAVVREPIWPGPHTRLTSAPDLGKYRFKVIDAATGAALFEQGYSTLFGEWQTTEEASSVKRVFHESLRFPMPREAVLVQIYSRSAKGLLDRVFEQKIEPESHLVRGWAEDREAEIVVLKDSGDPRTRLDIAVVCDGYPRAQAEKARRDLKRFSDILLATAPFDRHAERISVRGVLVPSDRTGPDEPRKGLFSDSPAGTSFNTFDSERYLTTVDNEALRDLAAHVPYDTVFIMVNSSRYGGAGIYNFFSIFVSDNEYDDYVFVHEFGHGFAGLGDEYYSSSVAYSEFYPKGVEPWEPNITALLGGAQSLKWRDLVPSGVPVPTPDSEQYSGTTGAFEGAGYSAKGLYRPAPDCRMFSKRHMDFCPVCMRAVEETIKLYTEQ